MSIEAALLKIGTSVATLVARAWLDQHRKNAERSQGLIEIVQRQGLALTPQRRLNRQFEQLAETISEKLSDYVYIEYRALPENEKMAALRAVVSTFDRADLSDAALYRSNLSDSKLYAILEPDALQCARREVLSEAGTELFKLVLREAIANTTEVIVSLPSFQARTLKELLARESAIIDTLREILRRMPQRASGGLIRSSLEFELEYRREVARKLDEVELFGVTTAGPSRRYRLSIAYIELTFGHTGSDGNYSSQGESRQVGEVLVARKRLLIDGQAGSGKTTLLRWLAVNCARKAFEGALTDWNTLLPVFIRLRRYVDRDLPDPTQFTSGVGWQLGNQPVDWMSTLLSSGKVLMLVDGVDELPDSRRRDAYEWLRDLMSAYPDCQYIVTSRPAALDYSWLSEFPVAELQPMTGSRIKLFVRKWHEAASLDLSPDEANGLEIVRARLLARLDTSRALRALATNPLMCALLCALNRDRRSHIPESRIELYNTALQMLLGRRDVERQIFDVVGDALSLDDKIKILSDLAYWFTINKFVDASRDRVRNQIENTIAMLPGKRSDGGAVFHYMLIRTGILREPTTGRIDFVHKTFQEYLTAKRIVESDSLEMLADKWDQSDYRDLTVMAVGQARPREQDRLIMRILDAVSEAEDESTRAVLRILAVSCLETATRINPALHDMVRQELRSIIPPSSNAEAQILANVGVEVIPLLPREGLAPTEAAACVRAAGLIGGGEAVAYLTHIASTDRRRAVLRELVAVWPYFSVEDYAEHVIKQAAPIACSVHIGDTSLFSRVLTRHLESVACEVGGAITETDIQRLSEIAALSSVTFNGVGGVATLDSFRPSQRLRIVQVNYCRDLKSLHSLHTAPQLRSLSILGAADDFDYLQLKGLATLRSLAVGPLSASDLIALVGALPKLRSLTARDCWGLRTPVQFGDNDSIVSVAYSSCGGLRSMAGVERFRRLRRLKLEKCNHLDSLEGLGCASRLSDIQLADCSIDHLRGLNEASSLSSIRLHSCSKLADLSALSGLTRVRSVVISNCPLIVDLSPLENLPNLQLVTLRNVSPDVVLPAKLAGKARWTSTRG